MIIKEPILLIPGVIAPNNLDKWEYFNGLQGFDQNLFQLVKIDHWGVMQKRSEQIRKYIDTLPQNQQFHLICHSKAGIDVDYLLQNSPELESRILSRTSIACPYQGSSISKFFYYIYSPFIFIDRVKEIRNTLKEIFSHKRELKTWEFKEYYIYGKVNFISTYPLFILTYLYIFLFEGSNDGFVSHRSCKRGQLIHKYHTDHIGLIGHFYTQKRINYFKDIIHRIKGHLYER